MPKDLDKIIKHLEQKKLMSEKGIKESEEKRLARHKKDYFIKSLELLSVSLVLAYMAIFHNQNNWVFSIFYFIGFMIHGIYYPFWVKPDTASILNTLMFLFYNSILSYLFLIVSALTFFNVKL